MYYFLTVYISNIVVKQAIDNDYYLMKPRTRWLPGVLAMECTNTKKNVEFIRRRFHFLQISI